MYGTMRCNVDYVVGPYLACLCLSPSSEWYEFARSTVEQYQQETLKAEDGEQQKKREEVLKLIKEELDVLTMKQAALGKLEFLQFVYKTHPPKNPEHKLGKVGC